VYKVIIVTVERYGHGMIGVFGPLAHHPLLMEAFCKEH
jgi:hypothetical protein